MSLKNIENKALQILEKVLTDDINKALEVAAFIGLYTLENQAYKDPVKAFQQTSLTYVLLKSGTEIGVTSAIGGVVIRQALQSPFSGYRGAENTPEM